MYILIYLQLLKILYHILDRSSRFDSKIFYLNLGCRSDSDLNFRQPQNRHHLVPLERCDCLNCSNFYSVSYFGD